MLNGKPEEKNIVRSVFGAIVTTPPQTFGVISTNLPRVRQSELLSPAELMLLLHEHEKDIGLKAAMEGRLTMAVDNASKLTSTQRSAFAFR